MWSFIFFLISSGNNGENLKYHAKVAWSEKESFSEKDKTGSKIHAFQQQLIIIYEISKANETHKNFVERSEI